MRKNVDRPEDRYLRDGEFRRLVDKMEKMIHQCKFTATELREAALLARIHYEYKRVKAVEEVIHADDNKRTTTD